MTPNFALPYLQDGNAYEKNNNSIIFRIQASFYEVHWKIDNRHHNTRTTLPSKRVLKTLSAITTAIND